MQRDSDHNGWAVRENGPADAATGVLMLPGGLESAAFYAAVVAELQRATPDIRLVATTLPGYGGAPALAAASFEERGRQAAALARAYKCGVIVGHSIGANVALEAARSGDFTGELVLLSPSFSRADESIFPRILDRLSIALRHLPYALLIRLIGPLMSGSLPAEQRATLIAAMRENQPRDVQRETRAYLTYLDRHGSLAGALCDAHLPSCVVFGERDDIKLAAEERQILEACEHVELVIIPGASHFTLLEKPDQIARLIGDAAERERERSLMRRAPSAESTDGSGLEPAQLGMAQTAN